MRALVQKTCWTCSVFVAQWWLEAWNGSCGPMLSLHACQKGGTRGKYQQSPGWVSIFQDPMGCLSCFNCANSGKRCPQSLQQGWTTDFILHQRFQLGYIKGSHTSIHQVDANWCQWFKPQPGFIGSSQSLCKRLSNSSLLIFQSRPGQNEIKMNGRSLRNLNS